MTINNTTPAKPSQLRLDLDVQKIPSEKFSTKNKPTPSVQQDEFVASSRVAAKDDGYCKTCASRTYQDKSNDGAVSFQSPTRVNPQAAASAVAGHEQEHLSNDRSRATEGEDIVFQSASLTTDICPECKEVYVSGGVAQTMSVPKAQSRYSASAQENVVPALIDKLA